MRITKQIIDRLETPTQASEGRTAQQRFYDDKMKGFGIRVTSGGTRAFFVEKRINGRLVRMTLGHYPELTVEQARTEAQKKLSKIACGVDPIVEKKALKVRGVTLSQAFEDYLTARKSLKPSTIFDYQRAMKEAFPDWQNKPLLDITKDMVSKRHKKIGETSQARANLAMRVLRAIYNFSAGEYEDEKDRALILENPVKRLSHTRAWYRVDRRKTILKAHELPRWYQALQNIKDERISGKSSVVRDYLLLILFTGLRRQEAARLKWEQVDFKAHTLTIIDTKNRQPHTLPLSDFLYELLEKRKSVKINDYVFPGTGVEGYIIEPRKVMQKVTDLSDLTFTLHDLRRTFITIAESLDIPAYSLKRLLNHTSQQDVTAGYIVMDVERLRKPMQLITDYLLKQLGEKSGIAVLNFHTPALDNVTL